MSSDPAVYGSYEVSLMSSHRRSSKLLDCDLKLRLVSWMNQAVVIDYEEVSRMAERLEKGLCLGKTSWLKLIAKVLALLRYVGRLICWREGRWREAEVHS